VFNYFSIGNTINSVPFPRLSQGGVAFLGRGGCVNILYMSWAQRRRLIYICGVIVVFLLITVPLAYYYFYRAPTCFDSKQNQGELGVDCGGPCTILCRAQYVPLNVLWSRFFKVSDGKYNVLAYIENPNLSAGANNLDYVFKLYDKNGLLLRERTGRTIAPANKVMGVFEAELSTGSQIPARVEFSFTSSAFWQKQVNAESGLSASQLLISQENTAPRLSFTLTNKTINLVNKIEAIGIIYNLEGNTIAFSRTVVDSLLNRENRVVNFNWPRPFGEAYARSEVILKVLK
jgi:hypothetical protein